MAWDSTATCLTQAYEVSGGLGDLGNYRSRWMRATQHPTIRKNVYIVREVGATGTNDEMGVHFLHYDMDRDSLETSTDTWPATASAATGSFRAPNIAFDPVTGYLWVVAVNTTSSSFDAGSPNGTGATGAIKGRYSLDGGTSWSSDVTIFSTASYQYPQISFGLDGTGFITAYNSVAGRYEVSEYSSGTWSTPTTLFTSSTTSTISGWSAVSVAHDGKALALVDDKIGAGVSQPTLMYYNGSTWAQYAILETVTSGSPISMVFLQVLYDIRKLGWTLLYGYSLGSENVRLYTVTLQGIPSTQSLSNFTVPSSPTPQSWMNATLDDGGNCHVITASGAATPDVYEWDLGTRTWGSKTDLDYTSQASPTPAAATLSGAFGMYGNVGRVFFTADTDGGSSNEDVYTAENPSLEDLSVTDLSTAYGDIVRLQDYTVSVSGEITRRLVAYVGDGFYDDRETNEFNGGLFGSGAFEPVADFAVFNGDLYIADGVNPIKRWNPSLSTAVEISGAPTAAGLIQAKQRLWAWGADSQLVYFSQYRDGTTWNEITDVTTEEDEPGVIPLYDLPTGEEITAGIEFLGVRYFFSNNGIMRITGDTPGVVQSADLSLPFYSPGVVSTSIGAYAPHSVVNIGTDVLFASRKGIHSLKTTDTSGAIEEGYVSAPIQPFFDNLDKGALERAQAVNYRRRNWYCLMVPEASDSGKFRSILCYDYGQDRWSLWRFDFNLTCLHTRINPTLSQEELLAGTDEGYVVKLDQPTRTQELGSSDYTATARSGWIYPNGTPRGHNDYELLIAHLGAPTLGTVTMKARVDDGAQTTQALDTNPYGLNVIGNFVIGDETLGVIGATTGLVRGQQRMVMDCSQRRTGHAIMVEFECTSGDMQIEGFEIKTVPGASLPDPNY